MRRRQRRRKSLRGVKSIDPELALIAKVQQTRKMEQLFCRGGGVLLFLILYSTESVESGAAEDASLYTAASPNSALDRAKRQLLDDICYTEFESIYKPVYGECDADVILAACIDEALDNTAEALDRHRIRLRYQNESPFGCSGIINECLGLVVRPEECAESASIASASLSGSQIAGIVIATVIVLSIALVIVWKRGNHRLTRVTPVNPATRKAIAKEIKRQSTLSQSPEPARDDLSRASDLPKLKSTQSDPVYEVAGKSGAEDSAEDDEVVIYDLAESVRAESKE